jgi:hypothetical protein
MAMGKMSAHLRKRHPGKECMVTSHAVVIPSTLVNMPTPNVSHTVFQMYVDRTVSTR